MSEWDSLWFAPPAHNVAPFLFMPVYVCNTRIAVYNTPNRPRIYEWLSCLSMLLFLAKLMNENCYHNDCIFAKIEEKKKKNTINWTINAYTSFKNDCATTAQHVFTHILSSVACGRIVVQYELVCSVLFGYFLSILYSLFARWLVLAHAYLLFWRRCTNNSNL